MEGFTPLSHYDRQSLAWAAEAAVRAHDDQRADDFRFWIDRWFLHRFRLMESFAREEAAS